MHLEGLIIKLKCILEINIADMNVVKDRWCSFAGGRPAIILNKRKRSLLSLPHSIVYADQELLHLVDIWNSFGRKSGVIRNGHEVE